MANQSARPTRTDKEELLDLLWPGGAEGTSSLTPEGFVTLVAAISQATGADLQAILDEAMRACPLAVPGCQQRHRLGLQD